MRPKAANENGMRKNVQATKIDEQLDHKRGRKLLKNLAKI